MEVTLVGTLKLNTTQQFKRDDATTWTEKNPVLLEGEPGLELDTGKIKIGDGVSNWNAIPYFMGDKLDNKANVELTNVTNQAFKSKADSAGVGKEKIISATYAELQKFVNEQSLIPGQKYLLSDYRTVYQQPITNVIKTSAPEQLLLTALDTAHFAPECNSLNYPQDIVTYDFNMNICEDDTTPRNGFITWRESTNTTGDYALISAPGDWRTMLWVRYKPDPDYYMLGSTKTQYEAWTSGKNVVNGKLYTQYGLIYLAIRSGVSSDIRYDQKLIPIIGTSTALLLSDISLAHYDGQETKIIKSTSFSEVPSFYKTCSNITFNKSGYKDCLHNNIFMYNSTHTILGSRCTGNTFESTYGGNILEDNCHRNLFMSQCNCNHLHGDCNNNIFIRMAHGNELYSACSNNIFHYYAYENILHQHCIGNYFMYNARLNELGQGCMNNEFHTLSMHNQIGNYCRDNILGDNVDYNMIGTYCSNNKFGINSCHNFLHSRVTDNSFGESNSFNVIFPYCTGNTFGNYFDDLTVKKLHNKNISNISNLSSINSYTIQAEQSGQYCYWYINSSGQMVRTLIP